MNDKILNDFLTAFSNVNAQLRNLLISLENSKAFKSVEKTCEIQKFGEGEPTLYFGIEANFFKPLDDDLHSAGMSFRVFMREGRWVFEGDFGWASYDLGYKEVDSLELSYDDIYLLLAHLQNDYDTLVEKYLSLIEDYRQKLSKS